MRNEIESKLLDYMKNEKIKVAEYFVSISRNMYVG